MKKINQIKLILTIFFLIFAGIVFCLSNELSESNVSDFFISKLVSHKAHGSEDIVLVVIDDASLEKIRWPWRRDLYSEMFDFLENKAGAKIVFFDAVLSSPDLDLTEADQKFYRYLKRSKNLVLGFDMCKIGNNCVTIPENYYSIFNKKSHINVLDKKNEKKIKEAYSGVMEMPLEFLNSATSFGSVIVMDRVPEQIDNDKVIRTYSNIVYFNGNYYPSLALLGYSKLTNTYKYILTDKALYSYDKKLNIKFPSAAVNSQSNYAYLKWYKPYDDNSYYSHKEYSAIDILNLSRMPKGSKITSKTGEVISADLLKDKIVFVGGNAKAQSLDDKFGSPVSPNHAGVDIQATALNNYLDNTFTQKASPALNIFIAAVILILSFWAIYFLSPMVSFSISSSILLFYFIIYLTCLNNDYILNFITVFFLEILLFAFAYIYQFKVEGDKKDKIQKAMGKYLSTDVMQRVVKDIDNIALGGRKTEATIMFIDIRKFTSISENMAADEVTVLLNEYFTTIYPIITKYKGVLNKFIGDAVLTIFEAPEAHAENAIRCADEVLGQVKKLQQKWLGEGKPKIDVGVGINSGDVFIGNIGTQERMEYTVIGDTVNTASRIEGYNKIYKTKFLIGECTYELVKDMIDVIKINQVTIRGKSQKINIYEVLRIKK